MLNLFEDQRSPAQLADDVGLVHSTRASHLDRHKAVRQKAARAPAFDLADRHALILGGTRRGKSFFLLLLCRGLVVRAVEGISIIDPHGSFARSHIEWLAHPASGQYDRIVHIIDPSSAYTVGLNPLRANNPALWEDCHDAAMVLMSVIESRFEASPEETPRLARLVYVAGHVCARHGLSVLELVELLSLGGEELRRALLEDFDNRIVRRELEDLCVLAVKSPREFLAVVESTKNRFVRALGDRRLARIFGQKKGLDLRRVFDNREQVIADLSSLNYGDAALVGALYTSMAFAAARRRPPLKCARHRLILDEAESLITLDVARMCDQSAKYGLNIVAAIQRLGQLRARDDFIADALLTNCAIKISFGGLESESARYVAENMFAGCVDLAEWKTGTERQTPVGQVKVVLKNKSRAEHHARTESSAESRSVARAVADISASMSSASAALGGGTSANFASMPDGVIEHGLPISHSFGHNHSHAASNSHATSRATSRQSARAQAHSLGRASMDGASLAEGESEALATVYDNLPTQIYSLEEQLHRLTAELMTLPRQQAFVRVESDAPFRARTAHLAPAFRSDEYKAELLPRYLANAARRSPYAVANTDIDRDIAARMDALIQPAPRKADDFAPQPPPSSDPDATAKELHTLLDTAAGTPRSLRIIPGGKGGDSQ